MSFGRATAIALQAIRLRGCAIGVANTRNLSRLCARFTARIRRVSRAMCSFHCAHTPRFACYVLVSLRAYAAFRVLCARFTARIRPLFCTRESASIVAIEVSTDRKMQVVVMYVID